jgi:hypothetical protein
VDPGIRLRPHSDDHVNGHTSKRRALPQAGFPQGSPLSPVLFLFFNADLVQSRINSKGCSLAFINGYSAWVVGLVAEANRGGPAGEVTYLKLYCL